MLLLFLLLHSVLGLDALLFTMMLQMFSLLFDRDRDLHSAVGITAIPPI